LLEVVAIRRKNAGWESDRCSLTYRTGRVS
jgi:hypothetical protein